MLWPPPRRETAASCHQQGHPCMGLATCPALALPHPTAGTTLPMSRWPWGAPISTHSLAQLGQSRQPQVPKGSDPEVPCGGPCGFWLQGCRGQDCPGGLAHPAKAQTQQCRPHRRTGSLSTLPAECPVSLGLPSPSLHDDRHRMQGPPGRASRSGGQWGRWSSSVSRPHSGPSCPKAVGSTPGAALTVMERRQGSRRGSHTDSAAGQGPQIGSRGGTQGLSGEDAHALTRKHT